MNKIYSNGRHDRDLTEKWQHGTSLLTLDQARHYGKTRRYRRDGVADLLRIVPENGPMFSMFSKIAKRGQTTI